MPSTKRKRNAIYLQRIADQVKKDIESRQKGMTYESGMAIERDNNEPVSDGGQEGKKQRAKPKNLQCRFCGRIGHSRRSSRQCGKHEEYLRDKAASKEQSMSTTNSDRKNENA